MALLKFKRSAVSGKVPALADLELGELAINTFDGKLYLRKDNGTASIIEVGAGAGSGVLSFNSRSGAVTLTSGDVTGALGFTPYNASNPAGYTNNTGTVTSVSGTGTVSGLTLTGTVTGSGSLTLGGSLTLTSSQVTTALGYTPYNSSNPSGYISSITSGMVTSALGYTPAQGLQSTGQQVIASSTALTSSGNAGSNILVVTAGITVTLPTSAISGKAITISNISSGSITLSYAGSTGTDGPTTMAAGTSLMLISDGGSPPFWRLTLPFGAFDGSTLFEAGYKILPQNQRTGAYTLALSDAGKHLYVTAGAFATTIPADATLNFPVGTAITFVCEDAGKTIVPASGVTLVLAGTGAATTGTRTLAIGAVATLIKVQANRWYISGSGVT